MARRVVKWIGGVAVATLVGIQLVPVDRSNPPVNGPLEAPDEVMAVLRKACFDCHSNETTWPWYSYVAPVSWLVAKDVEEGRRELNFSEWATMSEKKRAHKLKETWEEVEEGEMPLPIYIPMHPDANLTDSQRTALIDGLRATFGSTSTRDANTTTTNTETSGDDGDDDGD